MSDKKHHGVGLLIKNAEQDLFFVQQKDETYPVEKWRGSISFWGGKIEDFDTDSKTAVLRELNEEIITEVEFEKCNFEFVKQFAIKTTSKPYFF